MNKTTHILNISYTRSEHSMKSIRQGPFKEKADSLAEEKFTDGEVIMFRRPMGSDIYISLFGGENAYIISQMGGHGLSLAFRAMTVDGPAETLVDVYSFKKAKEEGKDVSEVKGTMRTELLEAIELHLPKEIVRALLELGYIESK